MSYLLYMMIFLLIATVILMAGIMFSRDTVVTGLAMHPDAHKTMRNALNDSMFWGALFFVFFVIEFILLDSTSV